MRMTLGELRAYLGTIAEGMSTSKEALDHGFALAAPVNGVGTYVLYDVKRAMMVFETPRGQKSLSALDDIVSSRAIVATLSTASEALCDGARTIVLVAAERGYGPLMYDIAMADGPLAPDRNSVSPAAERVWKHYYEHRPDVFHQMLSAECKHHASVKPWLNCSYSNQQAQGSEVLSARHRQLKAKFRASFVDAILIRAAGAFFDEHYAGD